MKTQLAIEKAGSAKALAELLDITGGAISQWGENVPKLRVWQLKVLRPKWFKEERTKDAASTQAQKVSA